MDEMLLVTDELSKVYKKVTAVNSVSLHIKKGTIYGLIGKNGAGKTTIMKMITGMATPTSGSFKYSGFDGDQRDAYSRIGALIEAPALLPNLSAYDNIKLKCLAYGIGDNEYIMDKLKLVGLAEVAKRKAGKFSLGMKQRLGIALALVGEPDLLVLDEPINGLDPQGIVEIREMLLKLNEEKGITIIISSHILEELAKLAKDYAIINNGEILEESTLEDLKLKCRDKIVIKAKNTSQILPVLDANGFGDYQAIDDQTIYIFERLEDISTINMEIAKAGIPVESIGVQSSDLEEYFIKLTGTAAGGLR
ncbi:ABC-2 type transport system ATP-binding protein [Oscillospiraceae bacterium]|nr:ABC-2 type transport system ATP-binding protein [Oscillospiraceae bacterium]